MKNASGKRKYDKAHTTTKEFRGKPAICPTEEEMPRNEKHHLEYHILCKLIRAKPKEDHENFRTARLLRAAEQRKSIKKCKTDLTLYRNTITALVNQDAKRINYHQGHGNNC